MTLREHEPQSGALPNGAAAAAILAAAIGCFIIGLMTLGAEMSEGLANALKWYPPAGPLSGKTGVGVITWLIAWAVLHNLWKDRDVDFRAVRIGAAILLLLGFLLTFPLIFQAFA
ncbi:hypothetical protein HRbin22_00210 [Candidatus Thermoflexus japonica]|uniref:Uncharacterized protein n=1 Tax=Candidatus Thermoflexus japonica TaxID=2035417 RepID=A0A2H5Y3I3_9CHLR|nr:hypothetical protein HRbin22_00210 [Candidatus Thermoflexus japonica]